MDEQFFMERFAMWLKALRKRMNLTQTQLAAVLDVSLESISRWEQGKTQPWASNLMKLFLLATEQERDALAEKAETYLKDKMVVIEGDKKEWLACHGCGLPLQLRDFTQRGWPAPPLEQQKNDPYAVRRCPKCQMQRS
jgi:transcriptional regulator with XRE-family HTH domain